VCRYDATSNLVTALGFGVLVSLILAPTPIGAQVVERTPGVTPPSSGSNEDDVVNQKRELLQQKIREKQQEQQDKAGQDKATSDKLNCLQRGDPWHWDPATRSCIKRIAKVTPETCQAKGPNYHLDPQTGRCIKMVSKAKSQGSTEQADDLRAIQKKTSDDLKAQQKTYDDLKAQQK
jgi:hypothetical protein